MRTLVVLIAAVAACTGPPTISSLGVRPADDEDRHAIRVVSNGWHTAIVVARTDVVATGLLPEADDFSEAALLEIGWGDRDYYRAPEGTPGLALAATLTPTPAVMHVAGRMRPAVVDTGDAVTVTLTGARLHRLVAAVAGSFARPQGGRATPIGPGHEPRSFFYAAHGTFHLFNTCNTWTARALNAGGVAVDPAGIVTADQLMAALREAVDADR